MVAYNFQKRFVQPIREGTKRNTIRRIGKRRHAKQGEALQLYCGQRTKSCFKIVADRTCSVSVVINIAVGQKMIERIRLGNERVENLEAFAVQDGFPDLETMSRFWRQFHGVGLFEGLFIAW